MYTECVLQLKRSKINKEVKDEIYEELLAPTLSFKGF